MTEFPVGFSEIGGNRYLENFKSVENAIEGAEHFVTYSDQIKWDTLVRKYAINPTLINVIRHAPNDLSRWITVEGFSDIETTSRDYCQLLFRCALQKASNFSYVNLFMNKSVKFIFYASQFRPSKNILTLLRAYEYLLRKHYIGYKLILTGYPHIMPMIDTFILEHNLKNDVLCIQALTSPELAACYKLACLAVNPSLSEGACPFTFTEALSVGTPVVMARIPVTEEIIKDHSLKKIMLFDPYDWRSVADCIRGALANREQLLALQQDTYRQLSQRNWHDVVNEHIDILDRISSNKNSNTNLNCIQSSNPGTLIDSSTENDRPSIKALDKPLVFLHIPKTAGTAFVNYLHANMAIPDVIAPPFMGDLSTIGLDNQNFLLYWGHLEYGIVKEIRREVYFLTFLREPLARVISQYKSWHKPENLTEEWLAVMQPDQIEAVKFTQSATLEEFIMSDNPYIIGHIRDVQTRFLSDGTDSSGMLDQAIHNLCEKVYFFGITERFSDSIALFRNFFTQTDPYVLARSSENRSLMTVPSLSTAAMQRVRDLNQNDFALYDFALKRFDNIFSESFTGARAAASF